MPTGAIAEQFNQSDSASAASGNWTHLANPARRILTGDHAIPRAQAAPHRRTQGFDDLISILADELGTDEALIMRLKKRKLSIRDEIARADAQLAG